MENNVCIVIREWIMFDFITQQEILPLIFQSKHNGSMNRRNIKFLLLRTSNPIRGKIDFVRRINWLGATRPCFVSIKAIQTIRIPLKGVKVKFYVTKRFRLIIKENREYLLRYRCFRLNFYRMPITYRLLNARKLATEGKFLTAYTTNSKERKKWKFRMRTQWFK